MALVVKDRVRETSTTAGTGTITLAGAVSGFQSFSVIGNGNTTYYSIVDLANNAWEVGVGTYTSSGTTLSRDTVLESTNSGNLVDFSSASKDVFVTYPAERSVYTDAAGSAITPATASILGVPSGGTGLSSGTSGGVPYYSASTTIASSAALAANAIVLGGGAGAAPATTTTGTGVVTAVGNAVNTSGGVVTQTGTLAASALLLGGGSGTAISSTTTGTGVVTALGVNTGTAGAFVVNGGALGTPSSGTVTNLTGTASININGTVGATTPNTGAFTSITSTSASGISQVQSANQDGVKILGRAGGSSGYLVTLTPATLAASVTLTLPAATDTLVGKATTDTLTNKTLTNPTVTNYVETLYSATGSTSVDLANGTIQLITTSGSTTVTLPSSVAGKSFTIIVKYAAADALAWAGGSTLKWSNGTTPTATSSANKFDIFSFFQDGTNTYGIVNGQNY